MRDTVGVVVGEVVVVRVEVSGAQAPEGPPRWAARSVCRARSAPRPRATPPPGAPYATSLLLRLQDPHLGPVLMVLERVRVSQ